MCSLTPCDLVSHRRLRPTHSPGPASDRSTRPSWTDSRLWSVLRVVPTFTAVRLTREASGFAPAASPWLRRSPSPWPPGPSFRDQTRSSPLPHARGQRVRAAYQPRSAGLELAAHQEAYRHRFLAYAFSSCSPGPTHPAVLSRPDFVEAAPTLPGDPRVRLPPASPHRYDGKATKVSHLRSIRQRLVAHRKVSQSPDPKSRRNRVRHTTLVEDAPR